MRRKIKNTSWLRIINSYVTATFSITLLLFLLGIITILYISSHQLEKYVKENISFNIFLKEGSNELEVLKLQKLLDSKAYVKSTKYVTREMAAEVLKADLGESFLELLDENPLPPSIEVKYHADYAVPDSINKIEKEITQYPIVDEVYYQKDLLYVIYNNLTRISFFVFIISLLLLIIAIALINNTIRLLIYSRRFLIKTMQLIGATRTFIRKPYILKSMLQGLIAAILACSLLTMLVYYLQNEVSEVLSLFNVEILGLTYAVIISSGLIISFLSSYFAVNKYLRIRGTELYY